MKDVERVATVERMLDAWNRRDFDAVAGLFAPDGVLHSMMREPLVGRDAIHRHLLTLQSAKPGTRVDIRVRHVGVIDGLVFAEREDHLEIEGRRGRIPAIGVFRVDDGQVAFWREYFDLETLRRETGRRSTSNDETAAGRGAADDSITSGEREAMDISRRAAVLGGLSASAVTLMRPSTADAAPACEATATSNVDQTNILRHYVVATPDATARDRTLAEIKQKLGLPSQPVKDLTELGFSTAMVVVGKTVIEVVAPHAPGKRPHVDSFLKERGGPGLYKLVVQTFDPDALRKRIHAHKLELERDSVFRGEQMLTLDTELFGTSLEAFTYADRSKWWGYDSAIPYGQSDLVDEILGCDLAIDNPGAVGRLVAAVFNAEFDPESRSVRFQKNTTIPFEPRAVRFVAPTDARRGVLTLDIRVKDRRRVGETVAISGVDFRFV